MVDQVEIHRKVASDDVGERREVVEQLCSNFADLPDKDAAWKDLIQLTGDKDSDVRRSVADALGSTFPHVPDKDTAWEDLHRLIEDEDSIVRRGAVVALGSAFQYVPSKNEAWEDLHRLIEDEDSIVRRGAAFALSSAFQHVPDKDAAWEDLHRLTGDEDVNVLSIAANALGFAFQHVPDKDEAWKNLIRLIEDEGSNVRLRAANALGFAFQHVPDKDAAWEDLHMLTADKKSSVRWCAAYALWIAFQHVPDKNAAWEDMHLLTGDKDRYVRRGAAYALGITFQYVPDKIAAWEDMHRLTWDNDRYVRHVATNALGSAFQHVPDKNEAWKDLLRLTEDEDSNVQLYATDALGTALQYVPDKDAAWEDLHRLTGNEDSNVRVSANHSLGRASIFKATVAESEGDFESELNNAIDFFERSSNEETYSNPSSFCLPFYRSFFMIAFEKTESKGEVQRYLAEAKSASKGSKNKETLLEAVENLASALTEAHKTRDFGAMKSDLNACMQYCNRAADLIDDAAEDAPGAAGILRRGMPIIDGRIKEIINEIQEKARAVCRETRGTPLEEFGLATDRSAQELPIQDPLALTISLGNMANNAKVLCELIATDDERRHACEQLKDLSDMELSEQGRALDRALQYITTCLHSHRNEAPTTKTVYISDTQKEIVRIAVAQFCFELTESFPFVLKNKDEVKTKVFSALEIAKYDGANILCLPELCLCEEWISEIEERYPDMIVIGGSFYKDKMNICPVIMKSDADRHYQPKITPSRNEDPEMTGVGMVSGDAVYIYETRFGRFMVLICRDFDHLLTRLVHRKNPDMIFCSAFNSASANKRFHNAAHLHVEKSPLYIMIANTGKYGGTSIFGRLHKDYFGLLVGNGCKDARDLTYKLCEIKEGQEEVILADFNLIHKSVQVPTPSDPNEDTRSVGRFKKIPIQPNRSRI